MSAGLSLLLATSGCEEDRPYTPFEVASSLPSTKKKATAAQKPPPKKKTFSPEPATEVEDRPSLLEVDGRRLKAPGSGRFLSFLNSDFNDDDAPEVLALIEQGASSTVSESVWLFPRAGKPRHITDLPDFLPGGGGCKRTASLEKTGPNTATLIAHADCKTGFTARTPTGSILILAPLGASPILLALRTADAAPQEKLGFQVISQDQDGDDKDDVVVNVTMHSDGSDRQKAKAPLTWFHRTTGPARDDSEPGVTLARLASTELVRSKGRKTSAKVPSGTATLRRLYSAICAESGTPRLFDGEGQPLSCGRMSLTFQRLTQADVRAYLKQGQVMSAFSALEHHAWFEHPLDAALIDAELERFGSKLERKGQVSMTRVDAKLPSPSAIPRWSPLAFDDRDRLRVHDASGSEILFTPRGELVPSMEGAEPTPAWPLAVVSESGRRFGGIVHSCNRSEISLTFVDEHGRPEKPVITSILAPRPGTCGGTASSWLPTWAPLGFRRRSLAGFVSGVRVGPSLEGRPEAPGTARSPDGHRFVLPTSLGLFVGGTRNELWSLPEDISARQLTDCTVSNDARSVACVLGTQPVLFKLQPEDSR